MGSLIRGRAHVFGRAHINTDEIIPARYLNTHEEAELARHAMEDVSPDFIKRVRPGDILVAGDDFGCGSSREHAVWALRGAGIAAVIANNYARIFFRNSLNNGFLAIECPGIATATSDQDELEIDLQHGRVRNLTRKWEREIVPLTAFVKEMLEAGGLLLYIARQHGIQAPSAAAMAAEPRVDVSLGRLGKSSGKPA